MELFFYENKIPTIFYYNIDEVVFNLYVDSRKYLVFNNKYYKGQVENQVDRKYNRITLLLFIFM